MIKYAEFCTGIGGFRLGIEQSCLDAKWYIQMKLMTIVK